ncbi:hypothetical protein [Lentzea sp. E54]|uniref:hypothetical protein n=1 Tax=Lentzea xerophila TaxID=3435883 RepID=UPI003DA55C83
MTAHITKPVVVLPANKVATEEILADVRERHPNHPRLDAITRVITGCGVSERYFTRPFTEVAGTTGIEARNRFAFADAAKMAVDAARRALEATGLRPDEVDGLVTSHTTSFAVPNLDVRLVEELGLRPDVARFAITTLGCAGGGQALVRATDLVHSRPGAAVLVVVAEALSTVYHRDEDTIESMIYKALFGDSAGACVVTGELRENGFAIEETLEFLLPDSADRYWGELDSGGLHFKSTKKAVAAAADALPGVLAWLGDRRPSFGVIHPGGPHIITQAAALELRHVDARHSFDSLRENGNLGGNAVLDVLRRTHEAPPATGTEGVIIAFGPGFAVAGARGTWR